MESSEQDDAPRRSGASGLSGNFAGTRPALRSALFSVSCLVIAGVALGPLGDPASRASRPEKDAMHGILSAGTAGEGLLIASLGGLRTLTADAFWLRAYAMWEKRDRAACTLYARAACALSPETTSLKVWYAEWLGLDFPHWTVASLGGRTRVPEAEQKLIHRRDALAAVDRLDEAMRDDPEEPRYALKAGQIVDIKLGDRPLAASYYRHAAETPPAPWYPAMLYTSYLDENGRHDEAVAWLRSYVARCPEGSMARRLATQRLTGLGMQK